MKYLAMLLFLLSSRAFACNNKAPLSAIEEYASLARTPGVTCSERVSDQCLCFDHIEGWDVAEIQDETYPIPVYSSKELETSCEDIPSCEQLRNSLCSHDPDFKFFYAENLILPGYEAYCVKVIGHNQVPTGKKILVNSPQKIAQKAAVAQAKAQTEALISAGKKAREACQRVLDLIGGFNLLPGRTSEQAGQMVTTFEAAKSHLQDGRPTAAKAAIQAIPVDGVLVTQPMKDLALAQLQDY